MTNEEAINWLNTLYMRTDITDEYGDMEDMQPYEEAVNMAIKALEQEPKPCDTCRHYENGCHWLPSVTPLEQEPFVNKPCVSEKVCEHDKQMVLDRIRVEIEQRPYGVANVGLLLGMKYERGFILEIIDKYKAESEE